MGVYMQSYLEGVGRYAVIILEKVRYRRADRILAISKQTFSACGCGCGCGLDVYAGQVA